MLILYVGKSSRLAGDTNSPSLAPGGKRSRAGGAPCRDAVHTDTCAH